MHIKNQQFQKTAVKCKDGKMLHLRSRQEVDISKVELDEVHLKTMLDRGHVAMRGESSKSVKPLETSAAPKLEKAEASGANDPAHKESEGSKPTSKRK